MLISSSQALDMLSAHAPRPWAKRVICWQIYIGELELYFASGSITETRYALRYYHDLQEGSAGTIADIKREFGDETAKAVQAAGPHGQVEVRTVNLSRTATNFPVEVLVHAEELDWESGTVYGDFHKDTVPQNDWSDEFSFTEDGDHLICRLSDMCFDAAVIEMMAPSGNLPKADLFSVTASQNEAGARKAGPGRRREYDWDGALLYLIGQAEKNSIAPNPEAHGAQADIKRKLADWFLDNGGKVPADSQLQDLAKKALEAIRSAKP